MACLAILKLLAIILVTGSVAVLVKTREVDHPQQGMYAVNPIVRENKQCKNLDSLNWPIHQ